MKEILLGCNKKGCGGYCYCVCKWGMESGAFAGEKAWVREERREVENG